MLINWKCIAGLAVSLFLLKITGIAMDEKNTNYAYLGGGCFWCTEALYETLAGVKSVEPGYAGGSVPNPVYKQIVTGKTGHAEVVRIEYDPQALSYQDLIDFFWEVHNPTTLNRQGADVGTQYRSIILTTSDEELAIAKASKVAASSHFNDPIVTEIVPLEKFYIAEDYHRDYYENNKNAPYCQFVITPKLEKLQKK